MTGQEDIDDLAAGYVLGTLDPGARAGVEARRAREPALEAAIAGYARVLAPLDDATSPVTPGAHVWAGIERRIDGGPGPTVVEDAQIIQLQRAARRWRAVAVAASALAACLAVAIGVRETSRLAEPPQNFVAVFQKDDQQPAFLLSIDLQTRELVIRPVTAAPQPGKAYQLWIVIDSMGPAPQSLGLLADLGETTRKRLDTFRPELLRSATFGISIEPPGGSPTGRPTGPAIHGRLIPAATGL